MSKQKIDNPIWQKKEEWWYNVWKKVESPFSPSKGEVMFYEKAVKKILKRKNPKALVLGATPEIRDMLAKYKKLDVYIMDADVPVYRAMTRLMKRKNKQEKLVVGDWLKMPFKKDTFDLILSHGAFSVISLKNHEKFYKNIKRVVKKDGYVVMSRVNVEPFLKEPISFKQIIDKYKEEPKYFKDLPNRVYILYQLISQPGLYNRRTQSIKYHVIARKLRDYAKKQGLSEKQIKSLYFTPDFDVNLKIDDTEIQTLKRLKTMIKKYFIIKETYQDDYHPVAKIFIDFLCQKRK